MSELFRKQLFNLGTLVVTITLLLGVNALYNADIVDENASLVATGLILGGGTMLPVGRKIPNE